MCTGVASVMRPAGQRLSPRIREQVLYRLKNCRLGGYVDVQGLNQLVEIVLERTAVHRFQKRLQTER